MFSHSRNLVRDVYLYAQIYIYIFGYRDLVTLGDTVPSGRSLVTTIHDRLDNAARLWWIGSDAGWSRASTSERTVRTCARAASPHHSPPSFTSVSRRLSVSLCAVWMEAGKRVYSATLRSPDLVQTRPTPSRCAAPVPRCPANGRAARPTARPRPPIGQERSVSPSYRVNLWRDNASGGRGRPAGFARPADRAAAEIAACAISNAGISTMPGHRRVPNTLLSHVMSTVCLPRVSHLSTRLTPRPSTLFFFPLFLLLLLLLFFAFCFVSVCNFPFFFSFLANFSLYFLLSTLPSFFVAYKSYLLARSRGSLSSFSLVLVGLIRRGSTLNSGFLQIRGCGAIRCSRGIYYW